MNAYIKVATPVAVWMVEWDETGILRCQWQREPVEGDPFPWTVIESRIIERDDSIARFLTRWLRDYRAGRLDPQASRHEIQQYLSAQVLRPPFFGTVWSRIIGIPPGKTLSYREVARLVGRPKASRAVGQAMARNPWPVLVPCHRVVGSGGRLGGYSPSPTIKSWLLDWERHIYASR